MPVRTLGALAGLKVLANCATVKYQLTTDLALRNAFATELKRLFITGHPTGSRSLAAGAGGIRQCA